MLTNVVLEHRRRQPRYSFASSYLKAYAFRRLPIFPEYSWIRRGFAFFYTIINPFVQSSGYSLIDESLQSFNMRKFFPVILFIIFIIV